MLARVRASSVSSRGRRGFSLIELMVVITIIGILAVLAAPAASAAMLDRRVYNDAGSIMQFFRSARARAIARGGAELISMDNTSSPGVGMFLLYEATQLDAQGGGATTPSSSCKTPTVWANPTLATNPRAQFVDAVNLNGAAETTAHIQTTFYSYPLSAAGTSGAVAFNLGYICYTPLGRSYLNVSTGATPTFDGQLSTTSPLELVVQRFDSSGTSIIGTSRSVLVPPNGNARLFSHL